MINEKYVIVFRKDTWPEGRWEDWLNVTLAAPPGRADILAKTRRDWGERTEFALVRRCDEFVGEPEFGEKR